jgi:hypothetical protein
MDTRAADAATVDRLVRRVGDELTSRQASEVEVGRARIAADDERQLAQALISRELEVLATEALREGRDPLDAANERRLAVQVLDRLYGLGPLQELLSLEGVTNIAIPGADPVWLEYADGRKEIHPPVVASAGGAGRHHRQRRPPPRPLREALRRRELGARHAAAQRRPAQRRALPARLAATGHDPPPQLRPAPARASRRGRCDRPDARVVPHCRDVGPVEHRDRRRDELGQDHDAALPGQRHPALRAADHDRGLARDRPRTLRRSPPRLRDADRPHGQHRGGRADHPRPAGPHRPSHVTRPGHRRRGPRRRDPADAARHVPGQRRVAVHHPRLHLEGDLQAVPDVRGDDPRTARRGDHQPAGRQRRPPGGPHRLGRRPAGGHLHPGGRRCRRTEAGVQRDLPTRPRRPCGAGVPDPGRHHAPAGQQHGFEAQLLANRDGWWTT